MAGVSVDPMGVQHGFLGDNGKFTTIDFPGAPQVSGGGSGAGGIDNRGDIAGFYSGKDGFQHGFLRARPAGCDQDDDKGCKPVFTSIDDPAAKQTQGIQFELGGMQPTGVLGRFCAEARTVYAGRSSQSQSLESLGTKLFLISDTGAIAGDYVTQDNAMTPPISHGFLLEDGKYTPIEVPGSPNGGFGTRVNGVNSFRIAVGLFSSPVGVPHGPVRMFGNDFTLDHPGVPFTELHSINNRGDITGAFIVDPVTQLLRGRRLS